MKVAETGQDRKVAALKSSFHVHIFFWVIIMKKEFMDLAFENALKAYELDEVPIGAVIVKDNTVISCGFNKKEENNCVMAHAELIAIKKAEEVLKNWRLDGCDIYVTLDPCPMCASAIKQSRIENVYSALNNSDINNLVILEKIFSTDSVNSSDNFKSNCDIDNSQELLRKFFEKQRNK